MIRLSTIVSTWLRPPIPSGCSGTYSAALLAKTWLEQAMQTDQPKAAVPTSLREFLRRGLAPMNLPPFLRPTHESFPYGVSRFYVEQGPLTPFWSLYMPEDIRDRRALFAASSGPWRLTVPVQMPAQLVGWIETLWRRRFNDT